MKDIEPVSGWSLAYIAALDLHAPGAAGAFLRASDERRQVIAALFASKPFPRCGREAAALAEFVGTAKHAEILSAAFPTVPSGLRGALARSGPQPHSPSFYRLLRKVLSSPEHKAAAKAVNQLDRVDLERLLTARRLPDDICTAKIVKVVARPSIAVDVAALIELFSQHGVHRPSLAEAICRVSNSKQLSELWDRWSQKLVFPAHPVPASEHYVPITIGFELRRIALRYRNCARHYFTKIMEGEAAFAEFRWTNKNAVIYLKRRGADWMLDGLFGKGNEMVPRDLQSSAEDYLRKCGVVTRPPSNRNDGEWSVLSRLSPRLMYDF
jgi:hypothetical protein